MAENTAKSRQPVEIAFGATQSHSFVHDHAVKKLNSIVQARL